MGRQGVAALIDDVGRNARLEVSRRHADDQALPVKGDEAYAGSRVGVLADSNTAAVWELSSSVTSSTVIDGAPPLDTGTRTPVGSGARLWMRGALEVEDAIQRKNSGGNGHHHL